jgi:hypothetical protein
MVLFRLPILRLQKIRGVVTKSSQNQSRLRYVRVPQGSGLVRTEILRRGKYIGKGGKIDRMMVDGAEEVVIDPMSHSDWTFKVELSDKIGIGRRTFKVQSFYSIL